MSKSDQEGYIYNVMGALMYRKQKLLPETIWGEADSGQPKEKQECFCGSGKRYENCHGLK